MDKLNKKDVGFVEDALTVLMNLLHVEVHSMNSYFMNGEGEWLEIAHEARKDRSDLLEELTKKDNSQVWCFKPGTGIITSYGTKEIQNIKVGDMVITHKNRFRKVMETYKHEISEDMISVNTNYSNIPIVSTEDHLFYIAKNLRTPQKTSWKKDFKKPEMVWEKAKNLTRNDFLYLPRYNIVKDTKNIKVNYSNGRGFKDSVNLSIDNDFMRLVGLYLAEGHHCKGRGANTYPFEYVGFTFNPKAEYLSKFVTKILKSHFNYNRVGLKRKATIEFSIGKRVICKFFSQFGDYAHTKAIPEWVINLPNEKLKGLVKGMFQGDGHTDNFSFSYCTVSKRMAYDLRLILNKLGVVSTISNRGRAKDGEINGRKIISRHDVYALTISGDAARKLSKFVDDNYDGGAKTSGNFAYVGDDYFLIPVLSITKTNYSGNVYNIAVYEDESYCTFNGVVHNCFNKHSLIAVLGFVELGNRKMPDKNKAKKYYDKAGKWLGIFMEKNKL
jgi:intein/homing endonuclease